MKTKIFYSWQSDIHFNNQAIRDALRAAITDLENITGNPQIDFKDSSSNLIGTTHIPESILRDIADADIFVCDLTIIGKSNSGQRNIANPNVLIELGYALSQLTWLRTIVVFNEQFGNIKTDLPFDIEKRSVLVVAIRDKDDANGKGQLKSKLRDWIQKIITENPVKPSHRNQPFEIDKRKEDAKVIRKIKKFFMIDGMDDFFGYGHELVEKHVIDDIDDFVEYVDSMSFFVNDSELNRLIIDLQAQFRNLDVLLEEYKSGTVRYTHKNQKGEDEKRFDRAKIYINHMHFSFKELFNYIRRNYPEVKFNDKKFVV